MFFTNGLELIYDGNISAMLDKQRPVRSVLSAYVAAATLKKNTYSMFLLFDILSQFLKHPVQSMGAAVMTCSHNQIEEINVCDYYVGILHFNT